MSCQDRPLDNAIILDTEDDIATKLALQCATCGNELEVTEIREEPERAVVLEVGACDSCTQDAHWNGFREGEDKARGLTFEPHY